MDPVPTSPVVVPQRGLNGIVKWLLIGVGVLVLVGGSFGLGMRLKSSPTACPICTNPESISDSWSFQPLSPTQAKSYAQTKDFNLVLLPVEGSRVGTSIEVEEKISAGGGAIYQGSTDPMISPDLSKTAYIKDNQLWLISADGKEKVQVTRERPVSGLGPWSLDSKYVVFYSVGETLKGAFMGMLVEETRTFDQNKFPQGVFLADTVTGKVIWLSPLDNVVVWVSPTKLLTLIDANQAPTAGYIVFDIEKFEADTKTAGSGFAEWFYPQISTSISGKWALSLGRTGNESGTENYTKIVVADYPATEGVVVEEGRWAYIQKPIISPNGSKLLFRKYDVVNGPVYVQYWDGNSVRKIVDGEPEAWVDDNQFIYRVGEKFDKYLLYDLTSGQSKPLN
ncbi:MAG: hypothetical protein Q7S31_02900 [bacterium]|nr:hypothetical protein [bacterium]